MSNQPTKEQRVAALEQARQSFLARFYAATNEIDTCKLQLDIINGQLVIMTGLGDLQEVPDGTE